MGMIRIISKHIILSIITLFTVGVVYAQGSIPRDFETEKLLEQGKKLLQTNNYEEAGHTLELAAENPLNQATTSSIYLAGISWFKAGKPQRSKVLFNRLIKDYPDSKYLFKAKYHKALIQIESNGTSLKELGLDMLFILADNSDDPEVKKDALNSARHYMFYEFDAEFLEGYHRFVVPEHEDIVLEALCYQLFEGGAEMQALQKIDAYEESHGRPTRYMSILKQKISHPNKFIHDELRIAIMMPFFLQLEDSTGGIPAPTKRALELFEGMKMALDSSQKDLANKVKIKVLDTQKDTFRIQEQLDDLESFGPDLIIGEITTSSSSYISRWAEDNMTPQLVVLNPSDRLAKGKDYTFLTHPSRSTHGKMMADHLFTEKEYKKVVVVYDDSPITLTMAQAFMTQFDTLGGTSLPKKIPARFTEESQFDIEKIIRGIERLDFDAIYLPLTSEVSAGYVIGQLNKIEEFQTHIIGSPDWDNFNAIDDELKEKFHLTYSSVFFEKNDTLSYPLFKRGFIMEYGKYPSDMVVKGYDIMKMVLAFNKTREPYQSFADVIREAPMYRGLHHDFQYNGQQDNQKVTIVNYQDGRIIKIVNDKE